MRCEITRTQKLMCCNIMRSTKSKKFLVLYYNIDEPFTKIKNYLI